MKQTGFSKDSVKVNTVTEARWTQHELEQLRQRLLDREEELRVDIQRELRKYDDEQYGKLADGVADPGEQSVADLLVDVDLAEITRDVAEVRDIEHALLRLAQGGYGDCVDCGTPIESARLHYAPATERCLECQERFERRGDQPRHSSL
jgi:DnaK suppressor protein